MTTITFTDDKNPDKKAVIKMTDIKASLEFFPAVKRDEKACEHQHVAVKVLQLFAGIDEKQQ
jgi:hypothetical protein